MRDNSIKVLEEFKFDAPKTKEFINLLNALELNGKKSLFVFLKLTRMYIYLQETYLKLKY
jgi:ribosomal protein L4